jgi:type IV pilus assembly protein PilQ
VKTLGRKITPVLLIAFWALLACKASDVSAAADTTGASPYNISEISYTHEATSPDVLTIKGISKQPPTFITYDLFDPMRVVLDIADGNFAEGVALPIELNSGAVSSVRGSIVTDQKTAIAKIEVLLKEDSQYTIEKVNNDIRIFFTEKAPMPISATTTGNQEIKSDTAGIEITAIIVEPFEDGIRVVLDAGQPITDFEQVVLPKGGGRPDRMYLDIHGASAPSLTSVITVNKGPLARLRTSPKENGTRIVFDSKIAQLFDFEIDPVQKGLQITIKNPATDNDPIGRLLSGLDSSESNEHSKNKSVKTEKTIPESSQVAKQLQAVGVKSGDSFVDAGYDSKRYSVDFYKTNIENVFYLLKELSGRNFVVDDSVSGTVTLYLEKVPWDFILDVVLNLKGLQKVEKFNTIVISPQSKNFSWPEDSQSDESTFAAPDQEIVAQIDEQLSQPTEVIEAKIFIQKANDLVKKNQLPAALEAYKEAFVLWPKNIDLIKRIANFCLVEMQNYVCAEDYAGKALALDEKDVESALQMAISRANMGRADAGVFFEKAIQGDRPTASALLSYAAYSENRGDNDQALNLLTRYESIYERTLTTMIAKARIFDKQNKPDKAEEIYEAILMYTGFALPADLKKFIKGRLALREAQH